MKTKSNTPRLLNSVGKMIFVEYFESFSNELIPAQEIVQQLSHAYGYSTKASSTRISKARQILKNGLLDEALSIIVASKRVSENTRIKAEKLLKLGKRKGKA
jgi:hypothetical protein